MASLRHGFTNALRGSRRQWQTLTLDQQFQALRLGSTTGSTRCMSLDSQSQQPFRAAKKFGDFDKIEARLIGVHARPVPVSPSYFSRQPTFDDQFLTLLKLMEVHKDLPVIPSREAERIAWKSLQSIRQSLGEQVRAFDYSKCLEAVKRLHTIHPDLKPQEVKDALQVFMREVQPHNNKPKPIPIDQYGRAIGVGRRKASVARAWVVEGTGEVQVNGKSLADAFGKIHDRETAMWPLKVTNRLDKYNVWAIAEGGGTTGQAEALTLAIAKGLMAHEPALKPALRRGKAHWRGLMFRLCFGFANCFVSSRMCDARPEKSREKEAWSRQGQKVTHLGQEIVVAAYLEALWCLVSA